MKATQLGGSAARCAHNGFGFCSKIAVEGCKVHFAPPKKPWNDMIPMFVCFCGGGNVGTFKAQMALDVTFWFARCMFSQGSKSTMSLVGVFREQLGAMGPRYDRTWFGAAERGFWRAGLLIPLPPPTHNSVFFLLFSHVKTAKCTVQKAVVGLGGWGYHFQHRVQNPNTSPKSSCWVAGGISVFGLCQRNFSWVPRGL